MRSFKESAAACGARSQAGAALSALAVGLALGAPQAAWARTPAAEDQLLVGQAAGEQVNQSSQPQVVNQAAADQGVDTSQIVATGTILRAAPPVGANLIGVGEERIASTGATTANKLMASVPQVSNLFNNVPTSRLSVASNQIQVVRPNLRNLAPETSSSASTLVLFDSHRIAPVGVSQNAIDPDLLPTIAIDYNARFKNTINTPAPNATIFGLFPNNVISDVNRLMLTDIQARLNSFNLPAAQVASVLNQIAGGCSAGTGRCNVYEVVDFRKGNYGTVNVEGLDFSVDYRTATSFGGIDAAVSANYVLNRKSQSGGWSSGHRRDARLPSAVPGAGESDDPVQCG